MRLHKITKQQLLAEPFSKDAQKLACAIYSTYINNGKELSMNIKISLIINLFKLQDDINSINFITIVLEELCEPIAVKDFKYSGNLYSTRFLRFFSYKFNEEFLEIDLNAEFLHAEQEYMSKRFLTC